METDQAMSKVSMEIPQTIQSSESMQPVPELLSLRSQEPYIKTHAFPGIPIETIPELNDEQRSFFNTLKHSVLIQVPFEIVDIFKSNFISALSYAPITAALGHLFFEMYLLNGKGNRKLENSLLSRNKWKDVYCCCFSRIRTISPLSCSNSSYNF